MPKSLCQIMSSTLTPNVKRRPSQPQFICQHFYQFKISPFKIQIPLESLGPIRPNSLNRVLPYLGAKELTIQGRGVMSQPQRMTLHHWCGSNSNLRPSWGQFTIPYLYGQFNPLWCSRQVLAILLSPGLSPGRILRQSSAIDFTSHRGQYKILLQSR
ncbi:hypothetical protein O181_116255 [Austropuccinia psidii MF-1]|uniref:Uncharacterized protein n=1 Tax=Austropuccinia psidii MF-1 TaxID=1389203 RepID=A0A9Q3K817_9BASI|nr:hypothetical protein [Austropuccinia psidii MF-1]